MNGSLPGHIILLVEDNEEDRFFLKRAFDAARFQAASLHIVPDGHEALAYLAGEGRYAVRDKFPLPNVLLLDLNMPGVNGYEVLKWVRAQSALSPLFVIAVSGSASKHDMEQALLLGANSYLVKSNSGPMAMMRCLRDWLEYEHFPALPPSLLTSWLRETEVFPPHSTPGSAMTTTPPRRRVAGLTRETRHLFSIEAQLPGTKRKTKRGSASK